MMAAYNKFGAQLNMLAKHCNTFKENSDNVKILAALINVERGIADLKAEIIGEA
ncbi:Bacterial mobilization protein (MobC) [compost metagenome]